MSDDLTIDGGRIFVIHDDGRLVYVSDGFTTPPVSGGEFGDCVISATGKVAVVCDATITESLREPYGAGDDHE